MFLSVKVVWPWGRWSRCAQRGRGSRPNLARDESGACCTDALRHSRAALRLRAERRSGCGAVMTVKGRIQRANVSLDNSLGLGLDGIQDRMCELRTTSDPSQTMQKSFPLPPRAAPEPAAGSEFLFRDPRPPSLSPSCSSSETLTTSLFALLDVALASHAEVVFLCAQRRKHGSGRAHFRNRDTVTAPAEIFAQ